MSMVAPLRSVAVKRPEEAFRTEEVIAREWQSLGYTRPPDLQRAISEHRKLVEALSAAGANVLYLPNDERTGLDSIYAHDPALNTPAGMIVFRMGKRARQGEG